MKCPKCQFENREKAKFCNECGHKFELTCPECGAANRAGSKFCDECGYKTALADTEEVHQIMDGIFKTLMDEIHRFEGTTNQFTGDGVMALFGAPMAHEDHAQRACRRLSNKSKAG